MSPTSHYKKKYYFWIYKIIINFKISKLYKYMIQPLPSKITKKCPMIYVPYWIKSLASNISKITYLRLWISKLIKRYLRLPIRTEISFLQALINLKIRKKYTYIRPLKFIKYRLRLPLHQCVNFKISRKHCL